ncbi:MAG: hypothetical protein WCA10_25055 [Terracidiphilus sp.]
MENSGPENTQPEVGKKSSNSTANIQANTSSKTSPKAQKKTSNAGTQKWTLREHWERASSAKRIKWIFEGFTGLVAFLILLNYVWQNLQTKWNFGEDQRSWINIDYHWTPLPIGVYNPTALVGLDTTLTNTGKSPITIARGEGVFELIDSDKAPSYSLAGLHSAFIHAPIPPTKDMRFAIGYVDQALKKGRPLEREEYERLRDGTMYAAVFGYIEYEDRFGVHWIKFCNWQSFTADQTKTFSAQSCVPFNQIGDGLESLTMDGFKGLPR